MARTVSLSRVAVNFWNTASALAALAGNGRVILCSTVGMESNINVGLLFAAGFDRKYVDTDF